ncbi:MAG TPA: hypothetical protein P5318_14970 [Candidatus Hydrogenedentes bacterium]|nr:hypothetical protein [Candidatus Hydrogenedentota bacterium]HRT21418.1 hypothetical protein [Candidatus Hydrogenedentota bacterium]HRT66306.1 hypothetical protein [Candidatus Hydrogenedentota bacterium]
MKTLVLSIGLCVVLLTLAGPAGNAQEPPANPGPPSDKRGPDFMRPDRPGPMPEGMRPEGPRPGEPGMFPPREGMPGRGFRPMPPRRIPERLEERIEAALMQNPDIRLAEARLHEAEAALMQVREQAVRDVTEASLAFDATEKDPGAHASAEARLRYLLGLTLPGEPRGPRPGLFLGGMEQGDRPARPPLPDPLRDRLNKPVSFDGEAPLSEIIQLFSKESGLDFFTNLSDAQRPVKFTIKEAPIREAMMALVEQAGGGFCFVARDYGVLAVPVERAQTMPGPVIPEYVPYGGPPMEPKP